MAKSVNQSKRSSCVQVVS